MFLTYLLSKHLMSSSFSTVDLLLNVGHADPSWRVLIFKRASLMPASCFGMIEIAEGCPIHPIRNGSRSAPTWRLVSDRHDPPTFAGVGVHYLKFTSAIPFLDMTSGVTVETVSNDSRRVVTTRQAVSKSHPFCDQLRIGCIGHECSSYILNLTSELPSFHRKKVPTTSTTTITTIITKTKTERMPSTVPSSNDHFVNKLLQFRNYDHAFPLWGKCIIFIFLFWIYVGDIRVTYTFCVLIDHFPYKSFLSLWRKKLSDLTIFNSSSEGKSILTPSSLIVIHCD